MYLFIALGRGRILGAARRVLWPNAPESLAQRRVRWETPLVVREPRPTKEMDFAPIDNTWLTANGEQRTVNG
jgi:hypothetical protein